MITKIWVIARNTLEQSIRQRLFLNIAVFGIGLVLISMVAAQITFGHSDRVVRSIGLSGVSIAVDLMALLLALGLIHQEIDKKTLFVILARPVARWQYVVGRYLGLLLTLTLVLTGFALVFLFALSSTPNGEMTRSDVMALIAVLPEAAILGGVGLAISTFSTPMVGAGMGLGFWVAAASTDDLMALTHKTPELQSMIKVLFYALPSLARLNFRDQAVYLQEVSTYDFAWSVGYGSLYAIFLVAIACAILSRREML